MEGKRKLRKMTKYAWTQGMEATQSPPRSACGIDVMMLRLLMFGVCLIDLRVLGQ